MNQKSDPFVPPCFDSVDDFMKSVRLGLDVNLIGETLILSGFPLIDLKIQAIRQASLLPSVRHLMFTAAEARDLADAWDGDRGLIRINEATMKAVEDLVRDLFAMLNNSPRDIEGDVPKPIMKEFSKRIAAHFPDLFN